MLRTLNANFRSSHRRCLVEKYVFKNFTKLTGRRLCQNLFLIFCEFIKKKTLEHRCFPLNFAKFLNTTFPTKHLRWLLLTEYLFPEHRVITFIVFIAKVFHCTKIHIIQFANVMESSKISGKYYFSINVLDYKRPCFPSH